MARDRHITAKMLLSADAKQGIELADAVCDGICKAHPGPR
jgi:hypothetical protein